MYVSVQLRHPLCISPMKYSCVTEASFAALVTPIATIEKLMHCSLVKERYSGNKLDNLYDPIIKLQTFRSPARLGSVLQSNWWCPEVTITKIQCTQWPPSLWLLQQEVCCSASTTIRSKCQLSLCHYPGLLIVNLTLPDLSLDVADSHK